MTVATPEPSATVVLCSRTEPVEYFFVQRSAASAFMPNAWVFPGGRLDILDRDPRVLRRLVGLDADALAARMHGVEEAETAAALAVCALRETFEESGLLLHTGGPLSRKAALELRNYRLRVRDGGASFPALLESLDLYLDGAALTYLDHWVTPPIESRRFDTRFFIAAAPPGRTPRPDHFETRAAGRHAARDALARHAAGDFPLAPPTFWILGELAQFARADEGLAWAAAREVPPVRPTVVQVDGALAIALPGDPLYPGDAGAAGPPRRVVWGGTSWSRG